MLPHDCSLRGAMPTGNASRLGLAAASFCIHFTQVGRESMRPRPLITTSSQQHELAIGAQADGGFVPLHGDRNLWHAELAKLPTMLADAQVARWQSKYGRDPTDQQRSWLVSKIRTDLVMKEIKLNTPVMIKNLQSLLEKSTLRLLYPESRRAPVGAYTE